LFFGVSEKSPYKKGGMFNGANHLIFARAKSLRKNMTEAEKILWLHLKNHFGGLKFRRQHPFGIYIADFYCHGAKLIMEVDGNVHDNSEAKINDDIRQKKIEEDGINVIRFRNEEVFKNIEAVLERIKSHLIT